MNNVKMPRSDSYREYLIESLKEPEESAGYLEAILEEKDAEPELLRNAIRKVIEARIRMNALSDSITVEDGELGVESESTMIEESKLSRETANL
ncbi:MAG: transcriptional regulator [Oscillatoriales cyanobacterium]|nr:MAG: transcriptional regulator [Oscillatoriales cyanobacterium]